MRKDCKRPHFLGMRSGLYGGWPIIPCCSVLQLVKSIRLYGPPVISISLDALRSTWLASDLTDADKKQIITSWLLKVDNNFVCAKTQFLVPFLNVSGDYVEVWCVPCAAYVPCVYWSWHTFLRIGVFLPCFLKASLFLDHHWMTVELGIV
jgi:hypothetical protein